MLLFVVYYNINLDILDILDILDNLDTGGWFENDTKKKKKNCCLPLLIPQYTTMY